MSRLCVLLCGRSGQYTGAICGPHPGTAIRRHAHKLRHRPVDSSRTLRAFKQTGQGRTDETLFLPQTATKLMVQHGVRGKIVLVSSLMGFFTFAGYAAYAPAKYALRGELSARVAVVGRAPERAELSPLVSRALPRPG